MAGEGTTIPNGPMNDGPVAQPPLKDGPAGAGIAATPLSDEMLGSVTSGSAGGSPSMDDTAGGNAGSADAPVSAQGIKDGASKLAKQATDKARDYVAEGKNRAGGALDEVSRLMGDAANTVDEKLGPQYGQYARTAAEGIAGFSDSLKNKEIEDLMADAQNFVRKSPAVAIGIAAALGFVAVRLIKAGFDTAGAPSGGDDKASHPVPASDA